MTRAARLAGFTLGSLLAAGPARAALGEPERSVERDRQVLAMERRPAAARAGATVHELASAGITVRQYVDPAGTVFAVAWSGVAPPDLPQLLGRFHAGYRAAAARPRPLRGPRRVEAGGAVVETWGHARALQGRAWIPSLVPPGVTFDDVR